MRKMKNNMVVLGVGVAPANDRGEWYSFMARLRPKDEDSENINRGVRDLARALHTFMLTVDIDSPNEWNDGNATVKAGPFSLIGANEYFGNILFRVRGDADATMVSQKIRRGLNAAAALLRSTGYYRVGIRYKPIEQMLLQEAEVEKHEEEEELPV